MGKDNELNKYELGGDAEWEIIRLVYSSLKFST